MFGFYFVNSWTPRLLVTAGMTESQGVVGGLMLTLAAPRVAALRTADHPVEQPEGDDHFAVLSAATMVMFISTAGILALAFVAGGVVGMLINGCIAGMYTITPALYGASVRSTRRRLGDRHRPRRRDCCPADHRRAAGRTLDGVPMLYMGVGAVVLVAGGTVAAMRPAPGRSQPRRTMRRRRFGCRCDAAPQARGRRRESSAVVRFVGSWFTASAGGWCLSVVRFVTWTSTPSLDAFRSSSPGSQRANCPWDTVAVTSSRVRLL